MSRKVTIKDIAKLVGVSTTTVSHYINGNYAKMSDKTKNAIKQVIEVTGYQPSIVAKGLATSDYKTIGVVIADITNPFISAVMKGIHDTCREEGYTVNFTNSDNDLLMEMDNLNRLKQQNVSGVILDAVFADNPLIKTLDNRNTVMVDRESKQLNIDTIVSDNENSIYKFIKLMQSKGYQDIYFVTIPIEGISTREQRYQGFQKAMELTNNNNLLVLENKDEFQEKIVNILKKSKSKPGFFTVNGPTLLSFMEIVQTLGYTYPEDYGIGSYEDLDWMKVLRPGITCIKQDSYQIGRKAALTLITKLRSRENYIDNPHAQTFEVPTEIVIRGSI